MTADLVAVPCFRLLHFKYNTTLLSLSAMHPRLPAFVKVQIDPTARHALIHQFSRRWAKLGKMSRNKTTKGEGR